MPLGHADLSDTAPSNQPTTIAAYLPRGSITECLVARDNHTLETLPQGATVGTSSPRRTAQLKALRPDLICKPIRGPVDSRVQQVHEGRFDAAILALAGLERIDLQHHTTHHFTLDEMLPEAGQGIIALTVRSDDWFAKHTVSRAECCTTHIAATAERTFARTIEQAQPDLLAAAACIIASDANNTITLHSRTISKTSGHAHTLHHQVDIKTPGTQLGKQAAADHLTHQQSTG